ncbi:MAG TPA: class I SAM-dependent methyltransferase [Chloroflexota bacterium]|nr:class I SAM-dependent methyltransferase [Chloroflexota bacterium]
MYNQIADYYDLTHAHLTEDIPFVLALARQAQGPVLELGCGSGRLLRPLAQAGVTVTGLDNSPAMLARARERLAQEPAAVQTRVTLVEGDMTGFVVNGRFPLILIPYNTFMHLDSAQALACLKQARRHLPAGGQLFIDLANPFTVADTPDDHLLSLENVLTDPDTGDVVVHLAANQVDTAGQILHITWLYDRSPAAGGSVHRTIAQATYHYHYPHQMELLLQEAGFTRLTLGGGYDESPFAEESARLLVLAEVA